MQARRISFLNVQLNSVFNECKRRPSLTFRIKLPRHINKDRDGYDNDKFLTSHLCTNKNRAKLDDLLWYQDNAKMYTIYPQQKIDLCNWLAYPSEKSSFPLYASSNYWQISSKSEKLHILVEVDLETYGSQASTSSAKLEDYGLIMAWTTSDRNMTFTLETDLEHLTNLLTGIMWGQYYVNNGLFVTRVQSVLVSGDPIIYSDTGHLDPPPDKNGFYALCNAARIALQQNKPKDAAGCDVQSQDKNVNNETFTEEFFAEAMKGAKSSNSAPTTRNSSPTEEHIGSIKYPYNLKLPDDVLFAVTGAARKSDLTNVHLPDDLEKKDNTEKSTNIDNKSTRETAAKNSGEGKENSNKVNKPPNVLICADTLGATDSLENLLLKVLERDRYCIHVLYKGDYDTYKIWMDEVSLVVLCGNVCAEFAAQLIEYIIQGGKLLALCSDMLHILLPSFKTAEVRENELVHFSYGKWKRVRMMHHIFCYHASPVRTRFSQDHEDTKAPALNFPTSINVKDKKGNLYSLNVEVLGREETWQSPSILLATLPSSGGKVVFSQIHLEMDPMQFVYEGNKFDVLKSSNVARLEIISDLLGTHLGLDINRDTSHFVDSNPISVQYTPGYFLGKFEMKMKMLEKLHIDMKKNNTLNMSEMEIEFCANNEDAHLPSVNFFPIMMHMCPPNFSTVEYFENLYTKELGRLVIYTDILRSSMKAIDTKLEHGLAVIPRQQSHGKGRYNNKWLSPIGCAMFTLQVHIPLMSSFARYVSLLQHIAAVALVSAVRSIKGYEDIDLRIKWPNDIYVGNSIKIGGILVSTQAGDGGATYVCNIGAGVNLSNSKPTTCINDTILQYNQKYGTKLEMFSYEKYLALVFNEMESLLDAVQSGNTENFYKLYYKYWLHTNANVVVTRINGRRERVRILGIDEYGYLLVQGRKSMFSVHSDGNSYDMFKGLIVPK
ncbi:biotin--protein ligase isoform X2 [Monomorium pharaonis]|nr:biotin--protein ligase isoform X2 [Monomorium pharaonis]